jgi:hypothetical protein
MIDTSISGLARRLTCVFLSSSNAAQRSEAVIVILLSSSSSNEAQRNEAVVIIFVTYHNIVTEACRGCRRYFRQNC